MVFEDISEMYENSYNELLDRLHKYSESCELGKRIFEFEYAKYMEETGHLDSAAGILADIVDHFDLGDLIFSLGCGTCGPDLSFIPFIELTKKPKRRFVGIDSSLQMLYDALNDLSQKEDIFIPEEEVETYLSSRPQNKFKFYLGNMTDTAELVKKEGIPSTIIVSYCFHWLNAAGLAEKVLEEIYNHLAIGGYFISVEEWPLNISFEQNAVNDYIRANTKPISLEGQLYPLIRRKGFVDAEDTICYDIDALQRLEQGFDTKRHTHVMYGKVFRKV